jgi:hypothetical protein
MKFLGLRILAVALWLSVAHKPAGDWADPPQVNCANAKDAGDLELAKYYGAGPYCGHTAGCPNC